MCHCIASLILLSYFLVSFDIIHYSFTLLVFDILVSMNILELYWGSGFMLLCFVKQNLSDFSLRLILRTL